MHFVGSKHVRIIKKIECHCVRTFISLIVFAMFVLGSYYFDILYI